MPECQRSPRGPKRSPSTGAVIGQASGSGIVGGGAGECGQRRRAGDAVRLQRRPVLEAAQGRIDVRAEDPVEGAGGKAVLGQPELQGRDVPALVAELELAGPQPVACEAAEGLARLRADDAVDGDVGALLKAANRLCGTRSGEPVDRALIKPMRAQADLKGGDARIGRRGAGGDRRGGEDQGQSKERPGTHGLTVFATSGGNPLEKRAA